MSNLANMFAVLNLDAEDDRDEVKKPAPSKAEAAAVAPKPERGSQSKTMIVNYDGENLASSSSDYKLPLVWIDLEMTGLDITKDRILEIACIITDGKLTKRIELSCVYKEKNTVLLVNGNSDHCYLMSGGYEVMKGPDLVIRQTKECLDDMNEWCKIHHVSSGLAEQVLKSETSEQDAEKQVLEFVRRYIGSANALIAGNSVYMDLLFLKKYMPQLAGIFSHVIVDVSSITALCIRWFPKRGRKLKLIVFDIYSSNLLKYSTFSNDVSWSPFELPLSKKKRKEAPRKGKNHRAMDDIRESIKELQYYKENIFKSRRS